MDSIERALLAACRVIYPKLLADPTELARRLARRKLSLLQRSPRAWCLAIRASDTRITPAHAIFCPEHAADPRDPEHPGKVLPHTITLSASLLRSLCQLVTISPPGEPWKDVARKLGVDPRTLNTGRISGLFRHIFKPSQANHRGKPVPILYTDQLLDPSARRFVVADPLWTWTATCLTNRLDLENRLKRKRQHRNATLRQHRRQHPTPSRASGSLIFRRFQWICPRCNKTARTLYFPLPPIELPVTSGPLPAELGPTPPNQKSKIANQKSPPSPLAMTHSLLATPHAFACRRCHRVQFLTGHGTGAWNNLIAHLSGGLLYGREVPRPPEFVPQRIHQPHRPSITRAPSQRREQITQLLLKPMTQSQIAAALRISYGTVHTQVHRIYKQHGVHSQRELARKLGVDLPNPNLPIREEVFQLTQDGLSRPKIMKATGLSYNQVHHHQRCIFREQKVGTCRQLRAKYGGKQRSGCVPQINADGRG